MKSFSLLTLSLVISLALVEGLLRLFFPQKLNTLRDAVAMYDTDPRKIPPGTRVVPKPNIPLHDAHSELEGVHYSVKTNNLGLLQVNDYHKSEAPLGLVLGDSFAAGVLADIDKNYFAELQKQLPRYTLLNLSVTDHGTYEQFFRLQAVDAALRSDFGQSPAFAVLHVYLGNDVSDNARYLSQGRRRRKELFTNWLAARLHAYRLYRRFRLTSRWSESGPYGVPVNTEFHDSIAVLKKYLEKTDLEPTRDALDKIVRYCRSQRITLYAVLIPSKAMASVGMRRTLTSRYGDEARFDYVHDFFRDYFDANGVVSISLTDFFLRIKDSEMLYHTYDSHWTEGGQRRAARYVAGQLDAVLKNKPAESASRSSSQ